MFNFPLKSILQKISKSLVSQFDVGVDKTRVALFKYSMDKVMINEIPLGRYKSFEPRSKVHATKGRSIHLGLRDMNRTRQETIAAVTMPICPDSSATEV